MRLFQICGLVSLLLSACQPPVADPNNPGATRTPLVDNLVEDFKDLSIEFQELARPNYVEAWVDQLIVKAQPGADMPEIGRMRQGEVAAYLKQRTVRKSTFTLRDQRFTEPWILIKTKDSVMGWVHQGGVRFVERSLPELITQNPNFPAMRTRSMNGVPEANIPDKYLVTPGKQVGPIKLNTTEEDLITLFGPGQVARGVVNISPVTTEPGTLIFPNTTDELRITWKDEVRTKIKAVYLDRQSENWQTHQGLRVGMSLSDLCKANEGPLTFYGFNWEYAGTVNSWRSGKLAPFEKKFYIVLKPRSAQYAKPYLSRFAGNTIFSSNTQGVEKLDLVVSRIGVYLD